MNRVIMLMMVVLLCTGAGLGQTYLATIQTSISGGTLNVDLYLQRTSGTSELLGDATLTFDYDQSVLTYVGKDGGSDGRWDNGTDASYGDLGSSNVTPSASLDITKGGSGVGLDVPGGATRIGRVQFTIVNASGSPGLTWNGGLTYVNDYAGNDITGKISFVNPTNGPLPVTMTSFAGRIGESGSGVLLQWATVSEVNNYGYTVQRKGGEDQAFVDLPGAFVAGHGTTVEPQSYRFTDNSVGAAGSYAYRLKQQDLNGAVQYSQSIIVNVSLTAVVEAAPREFRLMQNYPNPFNPATMVKFSVPVSGRATMRVYNMVGQEVTTLFDGVAEAGRYYAVSFNAAELASGVYFYRLVTEQKTDVRRMMLVK